MGYQKYSDQIIYSPQPLSRLFLLLPPPTCNTKIIYMLRSILTSVNNFLRDAYVQILLHVHSEAIIICPCSIAHLHASSLSQLELPWPVQIIDTLSGQESFTCITKFSIVLKPIVKMVKICFYICLPCKPIGRRVVLLH